MPYTGQGGGGAGGLTLGPTPNTFTAATKAAAETLRDAESAAWLALYDDTPTYTIAINWPAVPTNTVYQSRRSGAWADVTGLVRGEKGVGGPQSRFEVYAYVNASVAPTAAPTGGSFVRSTGTLTVPSSPTGYTAAPATPATTEGVYRTQAVVNPSVDVDTVVLTWSIPVELPAYLVVALAVAAQVAAEAARDLAETYAGQALDVAIWLAARRPSRDFAGFVYILGNCQQQLETLGQPRYGLLIQVLHRDLLLA